METGARARRRRRRVEAKWKPRRTLWCLSGLLVVLHSGGGTVDAGRSDVTWLHAVHDELGATAMVVDAVGAMVVTGCMADGEAFYVAKFSARGEPLWRETVRAEALADEANGSIAAACSAALATDAALNLYVAGTITREFEGTEDSDVFVARLSATGALVWTQTLRTLFADVVTSMTIIENSVLVGGYSAGTLALGRQSKRNCAVGTVGDGACDDGFVARLTAADGSVVWVHTVATTGQNRSGETRVFDLVAVGNNSLVVVGETRGSVGQTDSQGPHAGDVFVRRLTVDAGEPLWTTQLGGAAAEFCQQRSSSSLQYSRVYPRGHCDVAVHNRSRAISVVGSTQGLLSTFPSQQEPYRDACGWTTAASSSPCVQAFLARLDLETGAVRWMWQLVHEAHTTAERVVALDRKGDASSDVAMLATVDAGFFTSAESMEQLAIVRVSGSDGVVQWTAELGLAGEDHAVAFTASDTSLVVVAHGSADKSRRGQTSTQSWIRRVRASDGSGVPVCVDVVGLDKTHAVNATRDKAESDNESLRWRLAHVPLRRDEVMRCVDATATVRYRYAVGVNGSLASSTSGVVQFTGAQSTASVTLTLPWAATSLHVSLEAMSGDTEVDATAMKWQWQWELDESTASTVERDTVDGVADGHLWQQLTWVALVVAVVATALVVVGGRLVCWRSSAWSWRRAKAFEYTTLRLRGAAPAGGGVPSMRDAGSEETDELRSHLEEIQLLNDSLDGLLLAADASSSSLLASRSPALVVPSSPTHTKGNGWKRSLRRMLSSPQKKR